MSEISMVELKAIIRKEIEDTESFIQTEMQRRNFDWIDSSDGFKRGLEWVIAVIEHSERRKDEHNRLHATSRSEGE